MLKSVMQNRDKTTVMYYVCIKQITINNKEYIYMWWELVIVFCFILDLIYLTEDWIIIDK